MVGWISQVLIAVVVLVTLTFILRKLLALHRYKQMIDKLPGPKPKYKMSAAMEYNVPREYLFQVFDKFFGTYGSIVQVWNLVYFSADVYMCKPEDVEVLLNSIKHIKKSTAYERMESWLGTGLLTSSGTKWHLHRKLITPAFHFNILEDFLQVFVERSKIFVKKLHKLSQESEVDLMPLISRCTLDIVCETAMGTTFNIQESAEHENYVSTVYEVNELITYREYRPWLYPDSVYYRTAAGKRYMQCLQKLHSFTENVIRERKEHRKNGQQKIKDDKMNEDIPGYKRRLALLDLLLETCETMTHPLTDLEIREEVDTFMFEGHDTTAMAIVWTLYLLGKHPDIQEKVAEELDHVLEGTERSFTYDDLSNMKYLERVIKEAQRLYPSVPMIARWLDEDLELRDYTVPALTNLTVSIFHLHRDPNWYPNPETFDPDNFLPERVKTRHPYAFIPFSAGPRNCIGQRFAMMELKIVVANVIRNFKIKAVKDIQLRLYELTLKPVNGLFVNLEPRKK